MAHSQRLNDSKLLPWLILKSCGDVWAAHCTCIVGLGECCSHVGALLFYLEYACLKKSQSSKSITDVSAYWVPPSNKNNVEIQKINNINFNHPKTMNSECIQPQKQKKDFVIKLSKTLVDNQTFHSFLSKLEVVNRNAAILKVVSPYNLNFKTNAFPKYYSNMYKDENAKLTREELVTLGSKIDFCLTKTVCDEIEIKTKLQSNSKEWFLYRTGRITA